MKKSFAQTADEAPAEESQIGSAGAPERALTNYVSDEEVTGELDASDLRIPRLNIVAKTGDLSDLFPQGSILVNKETVLVEKDQPIFVIPVRVGKRYQEDTEFGEEMGQMANSLAEVLEQGGQIKDKNAEGFYFKVADIIFLMKKPEGENAEHDALFSIEIAGDYYLAALYTARKSSYTTCATPLFTAKQQGRAIRDTAYNLTSSLTKYNGNSWYRPGLRPAGKTSDAVKEFLASSNF